MESVTQTDTRATYKTHDLTQPEGEGDSDTTSRTENNNSNNSTHCEFFFSFFLNLSNPFGCHNPFTLLVRTKRKV